MLVERLGSLVWRAQLSGAEGEYVRPRLTERGPLAIVGGRHPLLEQQPGVAYQPNDTYLAGVH